MAVAKHTDNTITHIISELVKHGRADKIEYRGKITGGIINKAGLFHLDGKDVFVKYSTRDCVSTFTHTNSSAENCCSPQRPRIFPSFVHTWEGLYFLNQL